MANWFHRFIYPHCQHCLIEKQENNICRSCETLQMELERLRIENSRLLDNILDKPVVQEIKQEENSKAILPRNIPWNVRKRMLEAEDRETARLNKIALESNAAVSNDPRNISGGNSVRQLENELGVL